MTTRDDVVILEGGSRDRQAVPLADLRNVAVGVYELEVPGGIYRHSEEDVSDFRDGQRRATFEPAVPAEA